MLGGGVIGETKDERVIMRQTDQIYPRQIMEVDRRVRLTGRCDPGPKVHVVSGVEEILYTR